MNKVMTAPTITGTRNLSIDLIKIIAMSMVVNLHTTNVFINPDYPWIARALYNCGVVAVPLFFMVSGYLLIGRRDITYKYSFKKIFNILRFIFLVDVVTWIIFYSLSMRTIPDLAMDFVYCFLQMGYLWYFWFFGALIIIYLLYPIINRLHEYRSGYMITLLALLAVENCVFISNIIGDGETQVFQALRVWNWVTYFMLGGLAKEIHLDRKLLWASVALSVLATIFTMRWLYPCMKVDYCEFFFGSPAVIGLTVSIFLLISSFRIKKSRIIQEGALLFLPVYTIHLFVRRYIILNLHGYVEWMESLPFGCVINWLSVLLVSCFISYLIMKTPYLNRIFRI